MNRIILALLTAVLTATYVNAQQARLDSLLRVLRTQPAANAARMNTLVALGKVYSNITPAKGIAAVREARAIADKLNDDRGRSASWVSERYNYQLLGDMNGMDSCTRLAEETARRSGDSLALAHALVLYPSTWDVFGDTAAVHRVRIRLGWVIGYHRRHGRKADLAEALYWFGCNPAYNANADSLELALAFYEQLGDKSGMASCIGVRYQYEPYLSDPERTLKDQRRAAELAEEDGNLYAAFAFHGNLGWSLMERADYGGAMQANLKALSAAETFGSAWMLSAVHNNMGDLYMRLGNVPDAIEQYRAGLVNSPQILRSGNLAGLSKALLRSGEPDSAIAYAQKALKENQFTEDRNQAEATGVLGEANAMKGNILEALEQLHAALKIIGTGNVNYDLELRFSLALGQLYMNASDPVLAQRRQDRTAARVLAKQLLDRALQLSVETGMLNERGEALLALSDWYSEQGDIGRAFDLHKRYAAVKDSVLDADKAKAVALLQIQYETEKKEQQIVLLGKDKEVQAKEIQKQKLVRNGFMGGFALVALFAGVFLFQRNRIGKEKKRSEELLLNILPAEVAEELKAKGEADAKQIELVTVLFTDFKGFTAMSEQLSPKELVRDIHECFSAFDHIMHKHGIEKIKTIGDAYMAAGGLPTPNTTHALDVVKAALEIRDFIAEGKARKVAAGLPYFEIRIGIHTGPVVAGIVGVKKFAYDIWGDTVNTASRMESSGEVGQVNISESTFALVKDETGLNFTSRGKVQAKGKGEMEMYFVSNT